MGGLTTPSPAVLRGYCDHYEVDPPMPGCWSLRTVAGDPGQGQRDQGSIYVAEEDGG